MINSYCNNTGILRSFWKRHWLGFLFLAFCVFLSFRYQSLIMGGAGVLFIAYGSRCFKRVDREFVLLILALLVFGMNSMLFHNMELFWVAYYTLTPLFMYCLGKYYMGRWYDEDNLLLLLLLITVILAAPHIFVTIEDIYNYGLINPLRELQIYEDNSDAMAITQRTVELSLCTVGYSMLFYKPVDSFQKHIKITYVVIAVLSTLCFIHYISRTGIVLSAVALLIGLIYKRKADKQSKIVIVLLLLVVIAFVSYLYKSSIIEILDLYSEREIEGSSFSDAGGRTSRWAVVFTNIFSNPFGYKTDGFAHNMWLDYGKSAGILPFIFLSCFSLSSLGKTLKVVRCKSSSFLIRLMLLSSSTIFFLSCFTECIHEGVPMYMFFYCMFCGVVNSIYRLNVRRTARK